MMGSVEKPTLSNSLIEVAEYDYPQSYHAKMHSNMAARCFFMACLVATDYYPEDADRLHERFELYLTDDPALRGTVAFKILSDMVEEVKNILNPNAIVLGAPPQLHRVISEGLQSHWQSRIMTTLGLYLLTPRLPKLATNYANLMTHKERAIMGDPWLGVNSLKEDAQGTAWEKASR